MTASPDSATTAAAGTKNTKVASALLRYRTLAYATGIWLLFLCTELIARYGFDVHNFKWVEAVHGWVYFAYLLVTVDLAVKVRWPALKTVGTLLAGTIPFLSFVVEHRNSSQVKRDFAV